MGKRLVGISIGVGIAGLLGYGATKLIGARRQQAHETGKHGETPAKPVDMNKRPQTVSCPKCGKAVMEYEYFCPKCGAGLDQIAAAVHTPMPGADKKS
jgi:hypothetical protein